MLDSMMHVHSPSKYCGLEYWRTSAYIYFTILICLCKNINERKRNTWLGKTSFGPELVEVAALDFWLISSTDAFSIPLET